MEFDYLSLAITTIGALLSLLAFVFAYIGSKRAKIATETLAHARVAQEFKRCYILSNHLIRLLPYDQKNLCVELLSNLHDQILSAKIRHNTIFSEVDIAKMEKVLTTCRALVNKLPKELIKHDDSINGIRYISTCMLELSEKFESTMSGNES